MKLFPNFTRHHLITHTNNCDVHSCNTRSKNSNKWTQDTKYTRSLCALAYTKSVRKSSTVINWIEFPATMSRKVTDFSRGILSDFCVVMFYTSFWTDLFTGSSVQFVKQYATHKVLYNGEVKEGKMMGHWRLESFQSVKGEWKMWPVGSGHWTVHLGWVSILGFSLSSGSFY